jgi:chromosome segregation ATPase
MLWERDFDLLLELKNIPTKGQLVIAARRQALEEERGALLARQEDLKKRLAQIQGTYSTEFLLNEMMQLEVSDLQSVQTRLREELRVVSERIAEVEREIRKLGPPTG